MRKNIKIALLCLVGIPLICVLAILSIFLVKDANDFKPTIEAQAKKSAGIHLKIEDQLSWSLIPLGIEVNKLSILDQKQNHFASASKIVASINFWSLFSGKPEVETILLDGLDLHLIQQSETENNWSNILPKKTDKPEQSEDSTDKPGNLNFLIESLQLSNVRVHFESKPSNLDLTINPFNLILSNITLEQAFPISASYSLNEAKNNVNLDSTLNAQLQVSKDLSQFTLSNLDNHYSINAPSIAPKLIELQLSSNLFIDTETEKIDITNLLISLNELALEGQAKIQNYNHDLSVNSSLNVPEFSLKALLTGLGIKLPEMQASSALKAFALSTDLQLMNKELSLRALDVRLDETQWTGQVNHSLNTAASLVRLQGDKINLDDYLPASSEQDPVATDAGNTETNTETAPQVASAQDETLLPVDTLKELNLDIEILQNLLSIKGMESKNILLSVKAKQGKITQALSGKLFDGAYALNTALDVQNKPPRWQADQSLDQINLAPVFAALDIEALDEYGSIAGLLNFKANTQAAGNTVTSLQKSALSSINFDVEDGQFEGLSLNALTCEGFALINRESVDTSGWPKTTPFNTLKGSASLKQEKLSTEFDLITSGLHADSEGTIDIDKNKVKLLATLKVIGELGEQACRVNDKVKKLGIPVICKGEFSTPPAELCKLDTSRLGGMAKDLAVEEGKRKLNKEVDRALDKHLGDEKEPIKSLLNKFLK